METESKAIRSPRTLIIIYCGLIAIIFSTGSLNFVAQKNAVTEDAKDKLTIVSELNSSRIERWRLERIKDAEDLMLEYMAVLRAGGKRLIENRKTLSSENSLLNENSEYRNIYIVDRQNTVRSVKAGYEEPLGPDGLELARETMKQNRIRFGDIRRGQRPEDTDLDVCAPIFLPGSGVAAGAVILRIDPNKYLYEIFKSMPIQSPTLETLIVKKKEDSVLFLSELRQRKGRPLEFSLSLNKNDVVAVKAAKGTVGYVEGEDYKGSRVSAVIKPVPNSTWMLIAKIDKNEIFTEVERRGLRVLFVAILFSLAGAAFLGLLWYRQNTQYYKELYDRKMERRAITSHYENLLHYANDIIILLNKDLKVVEANDAAIKAYGYTSDELMHKSAKDLRTEESLATLPKELEELDKHGSLIFNTVHKRKDGTTFPVEVSTRVLIVEWQKFYQNIVRDISKRNT